MRFRPANIRLINRRSNLPRLLLALFSINGKSNDNDKNNPADVQRLTGSLHIRAFSIHMLPSSDRGRWLLLEGEATRIPDFCKEQNRKRCNPDSDCAVGPASVPGLPSGFLGETALLKDLKPANQLAFEARLPGACSDGDQRTVTVMVVVASCPRGVTVPSLSAEMVNW